MTNYPDRYVITGIVKDGQHKNERVYLYWTEEGGGWWQWGPDGWAYRFENKSGARFEDAMRCAKKGVGPYYYSVHPESVEVYATPAIVTVR
jgi:hypothetical protein